MNSFVRSTYRKRAFLSLVAGLLTWAATCSIALAADFQLSWSTGGVELSEGDKKVFFYQRAAKSQAGKYPRANYLHPLYDLDGAVITDDFPKDHPHHRGIFWTWHNFQLNDQPIGDPWTCTDIVWDVVNLAEVDEKNRNTITLMADVIWKSPLKKDADDRLVPLLKETTLIRVHKATKDARKIDFEIRLRALVDGLKLGGSKDDKGYSGFSTRIKLPQDLQFAGRDGAVEPNRLAVAGGPWMDFSGSLNDTGKPTGLAILQHPTLPNFPQKWILRRKTSMQNPQWPGNKPVVVPTDKPIILRHRLVLHRGNADNAKIDQLQREYEKAPNTLAKMKRSRPAPESIEGARKEIYKQVNGVSLPIHIYEPKGHKSGDNRPAIVFFFGGGWNAGTPGQFEQHCKYLASRGMVAMTAEYRVLSRHGVRAVDCYLDAKQAIRWARANSNRLGINSSRLAAGGGSAGGHLAAALGTIPSLGDHPNKDYIDGTPNALVLFNPALVLAEIKGEELPFPKDKLIGMPYRMGVESEALSPWHNIAPNQPPAIIFHGKADPTVIYLTAELFARKSQSAGNRCELVGYEGEVHGFFNYGKGGNKMFATTVGKMDKFLVSLGYLNGKATIQAFLK
jgi:acetyl esterase